MRCATSTSCGAARRSAPLMRTNTTTSSSPAPRSAGRPPASGRSSGLPPAFSRPGCPTQTWTSSSYKWRAYTAELLVHAEALNVDYVVLVGALLADVPHSRPIPVSASTDDAALRERMDLEASQYEGPVGIVGVLGEVALLAGLPTVSLWAAVPHYVAQAPSPKAQLALLHRVEELLQVPLDTQELVEDADAWERGVDELATEDPEIAAYVRQLEEAKDTADLPEASGESIAREFERYLKRRGKDKP